MAFVVITCGVLSGACQKEEAEPEAIPAPAQSVAPVAADPVPAATPTPAATPEPAAAQEPAAAASAATADADAGAGAAEGATGTAAPRGSGASIQACCSALHAVATKSGKSPEAKSKAATASHLCAGIEKLVQSGKTPRAKALTQIRASLAGTTPPAECN
ncbi:hypothetical protein BE17_30610 [Sorangium cellulosum]|uniref:Uncharacterized protein n=1 Tax=Sorangium cellulosum TaxID=56 RepID=A0A150R7K1_SORCE|nr:hypothetical protein BE17_30610 [Sorangium cellulosum]